MLKTRILLPMVVVGVSLACSVMSSRAQDNESPGDSREIKKLRPIEAVPKKVKPLTDDFVVPESEQPKKRDKNQEDPREFQKKPSKPQLDDRPHQEQAMQRLHHLQIAIQNLKAAGMHDLAKEAAHRAEAMENEVREMHEQRALKEAGRRGDELNDLRREIRQLHEALDDIRKSLKREPSPERELNPGEFRSNQKI
ncbi:MAG: hypothetical protein U0941_08525 [Planctomycetaceae bacterium]